MQYNVMQMMCNIFILFRLQDVMYYILILIITVLIRFNLLDYSV